MGRRARKRVEGGKIKRKREGTREGGQGGEGGKEDKEREIELIWLISSNMEPLAISIISELDNSSNSTRNCT